MFFRSSFLIFFKFFSCDGVNWINITQTLESPNCTLSWALRIGRIKRFCPLGLELSVNGVSDYIAELQIRAASVWLIRPLTDVCLLPDNPDITTLMLLYQDRIPLTHHPSSNTELVTRKIRSELKAIHNCMVSSL